MKQLFCRWCGLRPASTMLDGRLSCAKCAAPVPPPDDEEYDTEEIFPVRVEPPIPDGCIHCGVGTLPEWDRVCPECRDRDSKSITRSLTEAEKHAYRSKRRRDKLREAGMCIEARTHGPVFRGGRCEACWKRNKLRSHRSNALIKKGAA